MDWLLTCQERIEERLVVCHNPLLAVKRARNEASMAREAAPDGLSVLRTNVPREEMDTAGVVLACKSLSHVEQAFRHFKPVLGPVEGMSDLEVRAHLLVCMLAYWVQRGMQQALAPLLFVDETPPARPNPVAPAPRSERALCKDRTDRTTEGFPVHGFRTLLATLGTLVKIRVVARGAVPGTAFDLLTQPTPLQQRAFELLGLQPG